MMIVNRLRGVRPWLGIVLAAVFLVSIATLAPRASAESGCADSSAVFVVDSANGHLAQLASCRSTPGFRALTDVDAADWRTYQHVLAVQDGTATVVYATTVDGELWWRRQEVAGAPFGAPVRIGTSVDWSRFGSLFVSRAGYLEALEGGAVHTFAHPGWATGGTAVSEEQPLFAVFAGPSVSALGERNGHVFAEGNELGMHFRIWRIAGRSPEDRWYMSGYLPSGLVGVTGAEPWLYAVNTAGHVVLLQQPYPGPTPPRKYYDCDRYNHLPWQVAAESDGSYGRVVVPVTGRGGMPVVSRPPAGLDCDPEAEPYEWQSGGV
jgi:hypothetical protein